MKPPRIPIWVVVADQSRARLFKYGHEDGGLVEVEDIVFPEARLHQHEIMSDAAGQAPGRDKHDSYDPRGAAKAHRRKAFAHAIGERLETKRNAGELGGFYLIAEPGLLGELRATLSDPLVKQLRGEVPHHETQVSGAEIRALLPVDL